MLSVVVMGNSYRVLFVCMGNICRSPAAECVFRQVVEEEGLSEQIECDSAGTIDFHQGSMPDARIRQTGSERGYQIVGNARQVGIPDLEPFDLILVMDHENFEYVRRLDQGGLYGGKIRYFCDFVEDAGVEEVPDPYYGGQDGFEQVFDLLEAGSEQLIEYVRVRLSFDA